ncbi:MAG: DUF2793 domain-containing protein [Alphaproteobacteria bacterium]|nr:DUF2793 domain-containing protein [Alphaproteobacteria bacterium]MDE2112525.1 DUF2793 domain-containing protein [Alphaproteobacteria bacterium]MDE2492917.1 DUF2793 domain-containing protein [Alphaproteobacteria bacterium]
MNTPNLQLPYLAAAQAQKHVTVNEALGLLDTVVQLAVESRALTDPPASPADGACYIPASGAAGAWAAWDFNLAVWRDGAWSKLVPKDGWKAWIKDERLGAVYQDGIWRDGIALTGHGGRITLRAKEEELTLAGAYVETADAAFVPDRAIVLAVAARTTQQVAGAASYDVGISGEPSKFGGSLGVAAGSTNIGVIGPTAFYADTKVRITANGGDFAAGKVRLIAYFLEMTAPAS